MTTDEVAAQRERALEQANEVRAALKTLKRDLKNLGLAEGCEYVAAILDDPDRLAGIEGRLRTSCALVAINKLGDVQAGRMLQQARIVNAQRRLVELTDRQRSVLGWQLLSRAYAYRASAPARERKAA